MKRYAIFLGLIAFGYILGWTGSVLRFGLSPFPSRPFSHPRGFDRLLNELDLDPEQKERIRLIQAEKEQEKDRLRKEMDMAREEFEKALDSTKDREILQKAFDRTLTSRNAMAQVRFNFMIKIHEILTPEQIKQLAEKRPKRGQDGPWRRHDHRPPPPELGGPGEPAPPPLE